MRSLKSACVVLVALNETPPCGDGYPKQVGVAHDRNRLGLHLIETGWKWHHTYKINQTDFVQTSLISTYLIYEVL